MDPQLTIKRRRRWLMPLAIILIAAAFAVWGSAREAKRTDQVQRFVAELCRDIAAGRDVAGRINPNDPFAQRQIIQAIEEACPTPEAYSNLRIAIKPGDVAEAGSFQGKATHTALLSRGEEAVLGLRIQHDGGANSPRIIGYWTPPAGS